MMRLELAQGRGRMVMEKWFKRAMALSPNFYDAAWLMAYYLEPRWYGTDEDTLAFGRTCVASTNWGGQVPVVLANTHRSLAAYYGRAESPEYWQRPSVWKDVSSSYDKFFRVNPNAVGWHHNYAKDAFLCGHYDVFLGQTRMFTTGTNFAFFGGEIQFREMVAKATAAQKPK
jgi:hypothetical protein